MPDHLPPTPGRARSVALKVASELFYQQGVRAVGMDLIVHRSGIAKTTIYRHFPTKDALVEAFLKEEDAAFWRQWNEVVAPHIDTPRHALHALCRWIAAKVVSDHYRGCPQINVAAEFADPDHVARTVARRHKVEMVNRIADICTRIAAETAALRASQIALLFDGAFSSDGRLRDTDTAGLLIDAVDRLIGTGP